MDGRFCKRKGAKTQRILSFLCTFALKNSTLCGIFVKYYSLYKLLIISLFLTGCCRTPAIDDSEVASMIADRVDTYVKWRQGSSYETSVLEFIECASKQELSADTAIQIALLNNPAIQATFEELGLANADLVEAGLLSNPTFDLEIRYPNKGGLRTNIEYLITSSLLDAFLIPLKIRLAETEFEQTKLKVSKEILDIVFDVRQTYYELIAEEKKLDYLNSILELTSLINDLVAKQVAVGNIYFLELQLTQSRQVEAELDKAQSTAEIIRLREKFNKLLGFRENFGLILSKTKPDVDDSNYDLKTLEDIALEERLEAQVARFEIIRICHMLGLKEWWTYTNLRAGLAGERDPDGVNLLGPGFSGEIPLFNYGQASRMRLWATLRQAQNHLDEVEIQVLSEVRESHKLYTTYQNIVSTYKTRLLPVKSQISSSSEELYNVMGLGVDKLLENKLQELKALETFTEALKKCLVARVNLDRALGGNLFLMLKSNECLQGESE